MFVPAYVCMSVLVHMDASGYFFGQVLLLTQQSLCLSPVLSPDITLGVPRIREIINGVKNIKTPIIEARLQNSKSEHAARVVKARVETTTLGQVCHYIKEVYLPSQCYISIKLDMKIIQVRLLALVHTLCQACFDSPLTRECSSFVCLLSCSPHTCVPIHVLGVFFEMSVPGMFSWENI